MGMPDINIVFRTEAIQSAERSKSGVVAIILKDAAADLETGAVSGPLTLLSEADIPSKLSADNRAYLARALQGYVYKPRKVLVYVEGADAENLSEGLAWMGTQLFDYLAGPPAITATEANAVVTWIKAQRADNDAIYKAVLPNVTADCEAIVNFTTSGIDVGDTTYSAAEYCSRIAGMLAGTPLTYSCTYAKLDEVSDVTRLTRAEMDAAVDAGKLILYSNGRNVKTGRAVNSLTTITDAKGAPYKKIKIVDALDRITYDLRVLIEDNYIGKYPNSYDNKLVLLSAVQSYLDTMVTEEVIKSYTVDLDVQATEKYLRSQGVDTSTMTEEQIRQAPTGSHVWMTGGCVLLDAIEDVDLTMSFGV